MAKGRAVEDEAFDPTKVAGDTPAKRKSRARASAKKPKADDPIGWAPRSQGAADRAQEDQPHDIDPGADDGSDPALLADEYDHRPGHVETVDWELAAECAGLDQNDRDNGRRLILWYGPDLCYVSGMGWLTWRGTHWQRDEGELDARRMAQLLVDKIKLEPFHIHHTPAQGRLVAAALKARKLPAGNRSQAEKDMIAKADKVIAQLGSKRAARRKFAVSSGNSGKTAAMLQQAASFKAIDQNLLDADHMKFNVRNGTLVFSRGLDPERPEGSERTSGLFEFVEPQARADMLTKIAEVDYAPLATCPQWQAFLDRMMPDRTMQIFLQVFHAYAMLIGGNGAQKIAYHYGLGGNGKSALLETLGGLAGSYRTTVSPDTITGDGQRQGQQASPDIARLFNTRFVTVEELPKGVPLREDLVKAMSGGGKMAARFLQKEVFEFVPIFTAVLSGNTKPSITGADRGIWRRVFLIHWKVTMEENDPARIEFKDLMKRFEAERPGILNWLIDGAILYLTRGLMHFVPPEVTAFTEEYRKERDNIEVFTTSMITTKPGNRIQAGHLFKRYQGWCEANGLTAAKQRTFGDRLSELGFKKDIGRYYEYLDIGVRAMPVTDSDPGWQPADD